MYQVIWTFKRFLKNQKIAMSKLHGRDYKTLLELLSAYVNDIFRYIKLLICTKNQKRSPEFSEGCPLNRGFPLNRASTVLA